MQTEAPSLKTYNKAFEIYKLTRVRRIVARLRKLLKRNGLLLSRLVRVQSFRPRTESWRIEANVDEWFQTCWFFSLVRCWGNILTRSVTDKEAWIQSHKQILSLNLLFDDSESFDSCDHFEPIRMLHYQLRVNWGWKYVFRNASWMKLWNHSWHKFWSTVFKTQFLSSTRPILLKSQCRLWILGSFEKLLGLSWVTIFFFNLSWAHWK